MLHLDALGPQTPSSLANLSAVAMDCLTRSTSSWRCLSNSFANCCAWPSHCLTPGSVSWPGMAWVPRLQDSKTEESFSTFFLTLSLLPSSLPSSIPSSLPPALSLSLSPSLCLFPSVLKTLPIEILDDLLGCERWPEAVCQHSLLT